MSNPTLNDNIKWYDLHSALSSIATSIVANLTNKPLPVIEKSRDLNALPVSLNFYNKIHALRLAEEKAMDEEQDKDLTEYNFEAGLDAVFEQINNGSMDSPELDQAIVHESNSVLLMRYEAEVFVHNILSCLPDTPPKAYNFENGYPSTIPTEHEDTPKDYYLAVLLDGLSFLIADRNGYPSLITDEEWEDNLTLMLETFNKMRFHPEALTFEDHRGLQVFVQYYNNLWD